MLMNSVIALTFLTASSNNGGLNIDVQQEEEKRINNDLNQYDTTLFNKDSKEVNDAIAKQKKRTTTTNKKWYVSKSSESLDSLEWN